MTNAGAIDIGGTKIAVGVVDAEGHIVAQAEVPTAPELGYQAALERTTAALRKLLEKHAIAGIGVGSAGPIDPVTGVYGEVGTLPGWQGSTLAADLERLFDVPIAVENDADAAALGEAAWGAGRGRKIQSLIYVTISTGIGAGIILDGRLYRGARGAHPEIGHQLIDASAGVPTCYCGLAGCWESLASGPALEAWTTERSGKALAAAQICDLARQGEPLCMRAMEREVRYLGLGLANLVTMFCPQIIVLGGGMMRSADLLFAPAVEVVKRTCTQVPWMNTSIVLSTSNRLLGAARVFFEVQ